MNVTIHEDAIKIELAYRLSHLDQAQALNVLNTFCSALKGILSGPHLFIKDVQLLSDRDEAQIWQWNGSIPESAQMCVHDLLQGHQERRDKPAICSWDGTLTYEELDELSTKLAHYIVGEGVRQGSMIPICFKKSRWTVVAMLAVLKAGGAYATLDASQPIERMQGIVQDLKADLMFADPSFGVAFRPLVTKTVGDLHSLCRKLPVVTEPMRPRAQPVDVAIVFFTSGSTGRPKGVLLQHSSICTTIRGRGPTLGYGPESRVLQFASYAFAVSTWETWFTLAAGGCLCIPSEEDRMNNISRVVQEMKITQSFFTPSFLRNLKPEDVPSLKRLIIGGEPISQDQVHLWADKIELVRAYGMTENVSIQRIVKKDDKRATNGKAVACVAWITNSEDVNELAPIGAVGDLLIEGPGLTLGYLGDREKTDGVFVARPNWSRKSNQNRGRRLFGTGDIARYSSDGEITVLGRRDTQVKINGQRVELGEIEYHLLRNLPNGTDAVADVVVPADIKARPVLAAFICPCDCHGYKGNQYDESVSSTQNYVDSLAPKLEEALIVSLPRYEIPSIFLAIDQMPFTSSRKVDRKKLREMGSKMIALQIAERMIGSKHYTDLDSEKERLLQKLWADVLGLEIPMIASSDNFFKLGGDSLSAIKLAAAARQSGMVVTAQQILETPTLRTLGLVARFGQPTTIAIAGDEGAGIDAGLEISLQMQASLEKKDIEDIVETTDWQCWAIGCNLLRTRGWLDYLTWEITGNLDVLRIEGCCRRLVESNPILRTVFITHKKRLFQVIRRNYPVYVSQRLLPEGQTMQDVSYSLIKEDMDGRLYLGSPLVQFFVIKKDPASHRLIMRISHAQYDAMCVHKLFKELIATYHGQKQESPPSFSLFLRTNTNLSSTTAEDFWRDLLKGSSMTPITLRGNLSYKNVINSAKKRSIRKPSLAEHGILTATIVKAAWSLVVSGISNNLDVVFGNIVSGRTVPFPGVEKVVGACMGVLPVRIQLDPSMSILSLLQKVQQQQVAGMAQSSLGFRHIMDRCTDWPRWTRFSSIVNHANIGDSLVSFEMNGLHCTESIFEPEHDKTDLWLLSMPKENQLDIELRFCDTLFSGDFIEQLLEAFCDIIGSIMENPQAPPPASPSLLNAMLHGSGKVFETQTKEKQTQPIGTDSCDPSKVVVERVWRQFVSSEEGSGTHDLTVDTPFYEVWGEVVAASHLVSLYRKEGVQLFAEDIIDNPTPRDQERLCSLQLKSKQ